MLSNQALGLLIAAVFAAAVLGGRLEMPQKQTVMETQMKLISTAFKGGEMIPAEYSCDHDNVSPELIWERVPENTKSFVLIADDPDAPAQIWTHWMVYNIPPQARSLPKHVPANKELEGGALQGRNDFRNIGYGGLCPPVAHGTHHYHFKLYALDTMLDLKPGVAREELDAAMKGHILDWAQIVGIFERQAKAANG